MGLSEEERCCGKGFSVAMEGWKASDGMASGLKGTIPHALSPFTTFSRVIPLLKAL